MWKTVAILWILPYQKMENSLQCPCWTSVMERLRAALLFYNFDSAGEKKIDHVVGTKKNIPILLSRRLSFWRMTI